MEYLESYNKIKDILLVSDATHFEPVSNLGSLGWL
jgi:hypothetical protein